MNNAAENLVVVFFLANLTSEMRSFSIKLRAYKSPRYQQYSLYKQMNDEWLYGLIWYLVLG